MDPRLSKATAWHRKGQFDRAERAYRKVLAEQPQQPEALNQLGILLMQTRRDGEALRVLRRAVDARPDFAPAQANLGRLLLSRNETQAAAEAFQVAVDADGANVECLCGLAMARIQLGEAESAENLARRADALAPGHPAAALVLGRALLSRGAHRDSAETLEGLVAAQPGLMPAIHWLTRALHTWAHQPDAPPDVEARLVRAYEALQAADPGNETAAYMLQAVRGDEGPDRSPDRYVEQTFDEFADNFDESLERLEYRVPRLVLAATETAFGPPEGALDVIDAGCGTGLVGALLKPWARELVGVDLSGAMLEQAASKGVYDDLEQAELTAWLAAVDQSFDLVACADTLCYFGDLDAPLAAMRGCLAPGGCIIFTLQILEAGERPWKLTDSGRYSHTADATRDFLRRAGLTASTLSEVVLRQEGGRPVVGLLVTARAVESS